MQKFNQEVLDGISRQLDTLNLDSYLEHNHRKLYNLYNECDEVLLDSIDLLGPRRNIPLMTSIYLAKEYFKSIHKKYSRKLSKDILAGRIEKWDELSGKFVVLQDFSFFILISSDLTLMDSSILIHEYSHRLAINNLKKYKRTLLHKISSETMAILNEMKYLDFLQENGFSIYDLELVSDYRKNDFIEGIATFLFTEPLLDHYLSYGKLTPQNISDLQDYPYYENIEDVNYELKFIKTHPGKIKEYLDYIHPTATMVASFLHQQDLDKKELERMMHEISLNNGKNIFPKVSTEQLVDSVHKEFILKK